MHDRWTDRWHSRLLLLLLALLTKVASVEALEINRAIDEYAVDLWTTSEGLPHNQVQTAVQTRDGYLWFGTWQGLVRFNGLQFVLFNQQNQPALKDNGVRALLVDDQGTVWIGTARGGITRMYTDGKWDHLGTEDGLNSAEVLTLFQDRKGRVWIGFENAGLAVLDGDRVQQFTVKDGLHHGTILAVDEDHTGTVWVGTSAGLNRIDDGIVARPKMGEWTPDSPVLEVYVDRSGALLVGTEKGLFVRAGELLKRVEPENGKVELAVALVREDRFGALWIGTMSGGLMRYWRGKLEALRSGAGLPHNRIITLLNDAEGSLWVGTSSGLVRLKDAPLATYGVHRNLSDLYVRAVAEDNKGVLWVATSNGLNRFQDGVFHSIAIGKPDTVQNSIMSLYPDPDGSLWAGTFESGVVQLRDGQLQRRFDRSHGLAGVQVRAIAKTRDGSFWFGTTTGLSRFKDGQFTRFDSRHGLPRDYILSLYESRDGTLWVGTTGGFARWQEDQFETIQTRDGSRVTDVFAFHESTDGSLWLGMAAGIGHFGHGEFTLLRADEKRIPAAVFSIVEDNDEHLWFGTNSGVYSASRADLTKRVQNAEHEWPMDNYGLEDGMATTQCNGGSQPAAIRAGDGRIWFATARGVTFVRPQQLAIPKLPAPVTQIEAIVLDGKALPALSNNAVSIPAAGQRLEIVLKAMNFRNPSSTEYRYQLLGVDSDWVKENAEGRAVYNLVPPGLHRFVVQARIENGHWGPETNLEFHKKAFFYQTEWFRALLAMAIIGGLALVFWRKSVIGQRRERELRQLVEARTSDLALRTQELEKTNEEKLLLIHRIQEQSESFAKQAREDQLTGLPNRREFERVADNVFFECKREGRHCAVALGDLDHFKNINDRYSHGAGDEVLRRVGQVLREHMSNLGAVARYGGEEFVLMFADLSMPEVLERCELIRLAVEQLRFEPQYPGLKVSISIGVADTPDADHVERLLIQADAAMYRAKQDGRNCIRF